MSIEIKRYLVKDSIIPFVESQGNRYNSSLFYTKVKLCKKITYKKIAKKRYKIREIGSQESLKIINKQINNKTYNKAKKKKIGQTIKKDNITFDIDNLSCRVEIYKKPNSSLKILTVYSNKSKAKLKLPASLKRFVIKDVSNLKKYSDDTIIFYSKDSKKKYEIYKIFNKIEKSKVENKEIIFPQMSYIDAIRAILLSQMQSILTMKEKIIKCQKISFKDILELDNLVKTNIIALKGSKKLFKPKKFQHIYSYLKKMKNGTKELVNLYEILSKVETMDYILNKKTITIHKRTIEKMIYRESYKTIHLLQTREFDIVFDQYRLLLKEKSNIQSKNNPSKTIDKYLEKIIKSHYKRSIKTINRHEECNDIYSYKKIKAKIKNLKTIIELYKDGLKKDGYSKLSKVAKPLYDLLEKYNNLSKSSLMQIKYIKHSDKDIFTINRAINRVIIDRDNAYKRLEDEIKKATTDFIKAKSSFYS